MDSTLTLFGKGASVVTLTTAMMFSIVLEHETHSPWTIVVFHMPRPNHVHHPKLPGMYGQKHSRLPHFTMKSALATKRPELATSYPENADEHGNLLMKEFDAVVCGYSRTKGST